MRWFLVVIAFCFLQIGIASAVQCPVCEKETVELKVCGQCKEKKYCSRECQVQDWSAHKKFCKKAPTTSAITDMSSPTVRAVSITTAPLRYPQMMGDWQLLNVGRVRHVLLMGAGVHLNAIPQLHELQHVFPEAKIHVLDNYLPMKEVLQTSNYSQLRKLGMNLLNYEENFSASVDPQLREKVKTWLAEIRDELNRENIDLFLNDFMNLNEALPREQSYDLIVATNSLLYPLMASSVSWVEQTKVKQLLSSVLSRLSKSQGQFYSDASSVMQILDKLGVQVVEIGGKQEFVFDEIRYRIEFLGSCSSIRSVRNGFFELTHLRYGKSGALLVTSDHIAVITRLE